MSVYYKSSCVNQLCFSSGPMLRWSQCAVIRVGRNLMRCPESVLGGKCDIECFHEERKSKIERRRFYGREFDGVTSARFSVV